jgi:hypothetical protein
VTNSFWSMPGVVAWISSLVTHLPSSSVCHNAAPGIKLTFACYRLTTVCTAVQYHTEGADGVAG